MQDETTQPLEQTPEELAAERNEKLSAFRAILRTAVPTRIELLKRLPFDDVLARHDRANRTMAAHMHSGLLGKAKRQTGEAVQAFIEAIATAAFGTDGATIAGEHFQAVHPEVEAAKKRGRVLGMEGLLGFLGALTGSRSRPPEARPTLVTGMPPEFRDDSSDELLARRRRKFGTD